MGEECICAEPLKVGKRVKIKPCPLHGFFGEKVPPAPVPQNTEEADR